MAVTKPDVKIQYSSQEIDNQSFDNDYGVKVAEGLGFDGQSVVKQLADNLAIKVTVSGSITYIAKAKVGTAQATAKWQAMKIDETTGTVVTYADGNSDFDNSATDLTTLSYS